MFGRSALVVKEAKVDESADMQVKIVARKAGIASWFLSLLGIDSTFTLWVYGDRIESMEGSLSGRIRTVVPMVSLDTYSCGFTKPVQYFFAAAGLILFALIRYWIADSFAAAMPLFVLAIISILLYFFNKCLMLNFTTNGGNGIFFLFKRSVIEGIDVDETFAERVGEIVKRNYIAQTR